MKPKYKKRKYLPTVSIANNEVCVTVVESKLLKIQTPIFDEVDPLIDVASYLLPPSVWIPSEMFFDCLLSYIYILVYSQFWANSFQQLLGPSILLPESFSCRKYPTKSEFIGNEESYVSAVILLLLLIMLKNDKASEFEYRVDICMS